MFASGECPQLGQVSGFSSNLGGGDSDIVVHTDGEMQPGAGFFELARKLVRDTSDTLKCWAEELQRASDHWVNSQLPLSSHDETSEASV